MLFIGLGIAMVIMDTTIVNVSLPSIIDELDISSLDSEWIQAIYSLVFAALLIIFGRLGDRFGRRRLFVLGAIVFALASILAATTQTGEALIAARAIQGVGGAMMSPTSLSLINATYRGKRRTVAFAIYGSVIGGMAAVGPLLGGYLTENFSWRWSFGINIPVAIAIVVGSLLIVPESRDDEMNPGTDVLGAVLSAVGIGMLVFGLIEGRSYGWWTAERDISLLGTTWPEGGLSPVPVALAISLVSLVGLWFVEAHRARTGRAVIIDVRLFRIGSFGWGSFAALIVALGEFGILFSLPLFLQSALGYTAFSAGALLATLAVGAFIAGPTTAPLAARTSPRTVARLGMGFEIIGIVGLGLSISTSTPAWEMAMWLVVYGLGVGYASAQLTGVILADVPVRQSGQASGTQSTARQVGSALGTAVLGTVLFVGLANDTETRVAQVEGVTAEQAAQVAQVVEESAGTAIPGIAAKEGGQPIADAASEAFADSVSRTAFVAGGFVALGLAATLLLPPARKEEDVDVVVP
jgi:EmrB/QacA subfamily drug resistance transporter